MPAHAIAIFNAKGGVGKTSTAYNLAVALVRFHSKRVLLIDIDPQGHAGAALGVDIMNVEHRIDEVLGDALDLWIRFTEPISSEDCSEDIHRSRPLPLRLCHWSKQSTLLRWQILVHLR
ncbi:MAG: AAA family ATPase [Phormidium tanganyikae FI6-MK23]|nr:AAA family ATPase [Phormidium tanganyikae FI6-MK23]